MVTAYADALARTAASGGGAVAGAGSGATAGVVNVPAVTIITPNEISQEVFQWSHDEEIVDALYLQVRPAVQCTA